MTTRHAGYIVTLDEDIREDDAEALISAIRMIKHVVSVDPVEDSTELMMARNRLRHETRMRLYDAIDQVLER